LSSEALLDELYSNLTPEQFEKFLSVLLTEMGFSEVVITGRSGDRGIDLQATWTEKNVPGLEVDLPFLIQAKRFRPGMILNPRYVRELRGTLKPGNWGLLVTTARASSKTLQEGLSDPSRVISVIDGTTLIDLCKKYEVGMRTDYRIDLSGLEKEEITASEAPITAEINPELILTESIGERFSRLGKSSIYKSRSKTVIARISQRYDRADTNYWYATTAKDLERVKKYKITDFAYICSDKGVVLIPTKTILQEVKRDSLFKSTYEDGQLSHYHIKFLEKDGSMHWKFRKGYKNVANLFYPYAVQR
jgi:hypothetical protein